MDIPHFSAEIAQNKAVQTFMKAHEQVSPSQIMFKWHGKTDLPLKVIVAQIQLRLKAKKKFPSWVEKGCWFTVKTYEQSTSERVAKYKTTLYGNINSFIDLTAGLGTDAIALCEKGAKGILIDNNQEHITLLNYNISCLSISNAEALLADAEAYLKEIELSGVALFLLDPDRRSNGERTTVIEEYSPNPKVILELLAAKGNFNIWIKLSPMDDIRQISTWPYVKEIALIADRNEMKEVLVHCTHNASVLQITCHEVHQMGCIFKFDAVKKPVVNKLSAPLSFCFEPHVTLVKSGKYMEYAAQFEMAALGNFPLFTAQIHTPAAVGRWWKVLAILPSSTTKARNELKSRGIKKAHVTTWNTTTSALQLQQQLGISEGNEYWILVYTKPNMALEILLVGVL